MTTPTREEALALARAVASGSPRSYVMAAFKLAEYLLAEEAARLAPPAPDKPTLYTPRTEPTRTDKDKP